MQKLHFNIISGISFGLAFIFLILTLIPSPGILQGAIPTVSGQPTALVALTSPVETSRSLETTILPDELSSYFFLDKPRPAVVAPVAPVEVKRPPEPQRASDLSLIGRVVVDDENVWALYDQKRRTSFTIAVGKTWTEWTCIAIDNRGIILKKYEDLFVVPLKK